ncbi:MAG: DmsC/YnfH family molybdoenzyme membrane anchor subunit [Rhodoferax sp.]
MNPAFSVIIFTTVAGAAQGMVVALALAVLAGLSMSAGFLSVALVLATAMLLIGLGASFAHLGHPERAWRSALMWRTSWLSREVIVLPTFIGINVLWWLALRMGVNTVWLPLAALLLAALLWYCTAMIYACLRFIEEWAQPLTLVNFVLIGLSSGLVLACAIGSLVGEAPFVRVAGPCALIVTLAAWAARALSLRHNATLKHKSTLQSATGIKSPTLVQKSMGMSAGSFNTREFFHGRSKSTLRHVKLAFILLCFVLPALLALWGITGGGALAWVLAVLLQAPGLLAERWFFFAQAKHPQNLYYQVVS